VIPHPSSHSFTFIWEPTVWRKRVVVVVLLPVPLPIHQPLCAGRHPL